VRPTTRASSGLRSALLRGRDGAGLVGTELGASEQCVQALGVRLVRERVGRDHRSQLGARQHHQPRAHAQPLADPLLQRRHQRARVRIRAGEHDVAALDVRRHLGVSE